MTPNWEAKHTRHKRVFLRTDFFSRSFFRFMLDIKSLIWMLRTKLANRRRSKAVRFDSPVIVKDPFGKLVRQTIAISVAILVITSVAPHSILETGFTAEFFGDDTDFIEESDELILPPFLMNEEGFILKPSPSSEDVNRIGFTDSVMHTVVEGDTLSGIAHLYGISVKTLVWENNVSETSSLKIGQTLVIPAIDGVSHLVASDKETLSSLAKSYGVEEALIKEHNQLEGDLIQKGQKLFIPGGKKKEPVIARTGARAGRSVNTFDPKLVMSSDSEPREGKSLIFPTNGRLTQGFRGGHYANDIANSAKPDVWAAAAGTIVVSTGGCQPRDVQVNRRCNGGYGNFAVVDHGNGLQTLYAHLETIYVNEGQLVGAGQALGKMGNTGRSYGATGIHLHFEVVDNGVKRNPAKYY